jgi:hypothetical protein
MEGGFLVETFHEEELHIYQKAIELYGDKTLSIHPAYNEQMAKRKHYYSLRTRGCRDTSAFYEILNCLRNR